MRVDTFDHIVNHEWPAILNFIESSVRDRYLAEDLTQECFCGPLTAGRNFAKADLELTEIATAMGITEGSVKVHLSRAVQSIRDRLQVENVIGSLAKR